MSSESEHDRQVHQAWNRGFNAGRRSAEPRSSRELVETAPMADEYLLRAGTATLMPSEFDAIVRELILLRGRADQATRMAQAIFDGYPNPDITHKEYRVQVARWADDFLRQSANRDATSPPSTGGRMDE